MPQQLEAKVKGVVIISSPGPKPPAIEAMCKGDVPLFMPKVRVYPKAALKAFSKSSTSLPRQKRMLSYVSASAAKTSVRMAWCCSLRSRKGTFMGYTHETHESHESEFLFRAFRVFRGLKLLQQRRD